MNKQAQIYRYIKKNPETTLQEIADAMPWDYFHNRNKHFGEICSRMVKRGAIQRVKKGIFIINPKPHRSPFPQKESFENQLSLKF
ncbi:MAG: hypothetical protein GXO88_07855 [Chlorobi bacterium]|nr:hypothetical protein [Chlorobiota bacterium]